ncbi:hypothetical protein HDV00_004816, partial [Rhizophlyctis rosea]
YSLSLLTYTLARMIIDTMEREGRSVEQCAEQWHDIWREEVYAYNVHVSRVTVLSPYQMVFGQETLLPVDEITSDIAKKLRERRVENMPILSYLREYAAENRRKQHESAARREEERGVSEPRKYQPGNNVWIYDARAAHTFPLHHNILLRWEGPVVTRDMIRKGAYTVEDLDGRLVFEGRTHNHVWLKPYREGVKWNDIGLGPGLPRRKDDEEDDKDAKPVEEELEEMGASFVQMLENGNRMEEESGQEMGGSLVDKEEGKGKGGDMRLRGGSGHTEISSVAFGDGVALEVEVSGVKARKRGDRVVMRGGRLRGG